MLSDVVGAQVAALRKRQGLTREELMERVTKVGGRLSVDVLINIETRRSKGRAGAREVTVDEITALARALEVPPLLLLFPVGSVPDIEIDAAITLPTWPAARWFVGKVHLDGTSTDDDPGAAALVLHDRHQQAVDQYMAGQAQLMMLSAAAPVVAARELTDAERQALAIREAAYTGLVSVRVEMRRFNLTPPELPEPLAHRIDLPNQVEIPPPDLPLQE